jgi:phosphoribosyl 1,2-cyclic phosphodiesterase
MQCTILASGSKGNCLLIEGGCGSILIDAGLSAKEILRRLETAGKPAGAIRAILVTHEHGDHIRGVDVLSRRLGVPVYATEGTLRDSLACRRSSGHPLTTGTCTYHETFRVDDFIIQPFATSHDAAEPCGFCVREGDLVFGICTDTGFVTDHILATLTRCDGIVLESNHCPVMLKEGPYPESLKRRIRSNRGHLSNDAAADCLRKLGAEVPNIVLAHLSEVNNTPDKAKASARSGLGLVWDEVTVTIASQGGTSPAHPQIMRI